MVVQQAQHIHFAPKTLLPGKRCLEIVSLLATTNQYATYLVRDLNAWGKLYIAKVFLSSLLDASFQQRVQFGQDNSKSHAMTIYQFEQQQHISYLLVELIEGLTLQEWLEEQKSFYHPVTLEASAAIVQQLTKFLSHFHKFTFHGALHPGNIFLRPQQQQLELVVSDYYLPESLLEQNHRENWGRCQTPEHREKGVLGKATDMFALGVIFHELLTLESPFVSHTQKNISVPSGLAKLIEQCLASDPQKRPDIEQFCTAFKASLTSLQVTPQICLPSPSSLEENSFLLAQEESLPTEIQNALRKGDHLAQEGHYRQALQTWSEIRGNEQNTKEVEDRIMQVVDWVAEESQELREEDCFAAQKLLSEVIDYTEDSWVESLWQQLNSEIQQREDKLANYMQEAEKHLEKRQYSSALEVWQMALGIVPTKDEQIHNQIQQIKKSLQQMEEDEQELQKLLFTARKLEESEDYSNALIAWQKIQTKRQKWLCPSQDPTQEIERVSKLKSAAKRSQQGQELLVQIKSALNQKNYSQAKKLLDNPLWRTPLLPKVSQQHQKTVRQYQEQMRRNKFFLYLKLFISLILLALLVVAYFQGM